MRVFNTRLLSVVVVLAFAVFVTACGDDEGSPAEGGNASTESGGASIQETAKEKVAEFEKAPTQDDVPGPTEPFDPGSGKAEAMACGNAAPVCAEQAKFAVEALREMGWDAPTPYDGEFSPQKQAAFLNRAVQKGLDGVIMVSVDVDTIKSAVDRALDAGLTIACTFCVSGEAYKGKVYDVTADFAAEGEMVAWAALANSGDKTKAVHFSDKAFDPPPIRLQSFKETVEANCSSCEVETRDFATGSIAKPGPPEFNALLSSKPAGTVTDVVAHYDGLGVAMAKTLKQRGRDDITIGAYDITPESVQQTLNSDSAYKYAGIAPYTYAEWGAADILGRVKAKKEIWEGYDKLPATLMTPNNAERYRDTDTVFEGTDDWKQRFRDVWNAEG